MNQHHHTLKHLGDLGATMLTALSVASQWATVLTPIATLVLTLLGIVWWMIRFAEWWKKGVTGND